MRLIIFLFYLFPTLAMAETPSVGDSQVLGFVATDLTGDGLTDRAELSVTEEGGEADLNIWVRTADGQLDLRTTAKSVIWVGPGGQGPEITVSPNGSLLIHSVNDSIGRERWQQTLTVAWRNDTFVLAGFTYYWHDTLDPENSGTCDVNLLTGKGERTRGTFLRPIEIHTKSGSGPIDLWVGEPPSECFPNP